MFQLVKPYASTYPIDIHLFGTYAAMLVPNTRTHPIKQAHRFERWPVGWLAGFHGIFSAVHNHSISTKNQMTRTLREMPLANIDLKPERNPAKLTSTLRSPVKERSADANRAL